jgi:hypothetical protein
MFPIIACACCFYLEFLWMLPTNLSEKCVASLFPVTVFSCPAFFTSASPLPL